jgi:DoxX-like family
VGGYQSIPAQAQTGVTNSEEHVMFVASAAVSSVLAAVLLLSARGKLVHERAQMETLRRVGFPEHRIWLLAAAEMAGAAGLVIGLFWWPPGVAAAAGVVAYFIGAVGSHLRKGDWQITPPGVLLAAATAALLLRALTV